VGTDLALFSKEFFFGVISQIYIFFRAGDKIDHNCHKIDHTQFFPFLPDFLIHKPYLPAIFGPLPARGERRGAEREAGGERAKNRGGEAAATRFLVECFLTRRRVISQCRL